MVNRLCVPGIIFIVLLVSGCCCIYIPFDLQNPSIPSSLQGYFYMKQHSIMGSPDGDLSDYQMKFVIHRGKGMDNGMDVYLNGHSLSWPDDIRFTNDNGDPLSFWTESYDATVTTVWVKMDNIPASPGSTTIKLYYGKADEASVSNGDDTFILFDDFNDNSLDSGKWVEVLGDASADVYERNHELELKSGFGTDRSKPFIRSANTYSGNYTIDVNARYGDDNSIIIATNWDGKLAGHYMGPNNGYECFYNSWATTGKYWEIARDVNNTDTNLGQYDYDLDHGFHKISVTQKPVIVLQVDDKILLLGANDITYNNGYIGLGGRENHNAVETYYDDFRMRKYTPNPPLDDSWTEKNINF